MKIGSKYINTTPLERLPVPRRKTHQGEEAVGMWEQLCHAEVSSLLEVVAFLLPHPLQYCAPNDDDNLATFTHSFYEEQQKHVQIAPYHMNDV